MMSYSIIQSGVSSSFPDGDAFLSGASPASEAEIILCIGDPGAIDLGPVLERASGGKTVLLELGSECLALYGDDATGSVDANVLGFARYRTGNSPPSPLVELVRGPDSSEEAIGAATTLFERAGLTVAVCSDQAGRIIDRLVRPKYNAALRLLDEGLATQDAMDLTCRLGLGYRDGPIERVMAGGLADHYRISRGLFEIYGTTGYAPARSSVVAAKRGERRR